MHLADGIVDHTNLLLGVSCLGGAAVVIAMSRVKGCTRGAAWTGALAAFVLVAQAVNVPMVPGASAHIVGAGLMTVAVGPARAIVGMFAVLLAQALLFADGGVTALFVNALNLAAIPALATHGVRRLLGERPRSAEWAVGLGSFVGNVLGALSLSALLVLGANAPAAITLRWLVGIQAVAGVIEGVLAAISVHYVFKRAPALMASRHEGSPRALDERVAAPSAAISGFGGLLILVGCLLLALPFASELPDALEVVMLHLGSPIHQELP